MAEDPHAREIGRVPDDSGHVVIIGVDHDAVTVRTLSAAAVTLGPYRTEELGQALISAAWQAGWYQGQQAPRDGEP